MIEAMLRTALMSDQRLQALMDDPRPAFVWQLDGRALIWANRAGAQSVGLSPADIERQQSNAALATLSPQIAVIARKLPRPGAMRLERLRLPGMGALDTLSCACRSFDGPDGFIGLLVQAIEAPRRARRQPSWAPPAIPDTLPPLPEARTPQAVSPPEPQGPLGAWRWVDADADRSAVPQPAEAVPARIQAPAPPQPRRGKPVRFVFQTDAEGRFISVSSELETALGPRSGNWNGKRFDELVVSERLRNTTAIIAAFASRQTWTGLSFIWPDYAAGEEIAIALSASPVFQRNQLFDGFRGFGVAGVPGPLTAPAPPPAVEAAKAPLRQVDKAEPAIIWQDSLPDGDEVGFPLPPSQQQPEPSRPNPVIDIAEARNARQPAENKVVRLHNKPGAGERHGLTPTERVAFHEIARALGARIEGEPRSEAARAEIPKTEIPRTEPIKPEPAKHETGLPPIKPPTSQDNAPLPADDEERWRADAAAEPPPPEDAILEAAPNRPLKLGRLDKVPVSLIDRLPIGIFIARGEELQFVNRTMLELLGYADIDAIRRAGGLDHVFAGTGPVATGDEANPGVLLKTAAGEVIAVDGRVQTTHWDGESALLISVRRPVGETNGEKLHFAERRADELQAVLDTATDGVVILDKEGRIVSINRSAEALFGYEQREIVGKDLLLLFAPESHRAAFDYLDSLRSNGVASLLNDGREVVGRVRQGGSVPLFMTIGRLGGEKPGEGGKRFCAVLRDVTSFKKAETELTAAKRQAEEASSQKSDFLAKISHEVRTPLNAIIGFAEVMMEERFGPMGNERYRSYARDIHTSGEHVISLVNDLLDLSKIEAGRLDLAFTSVSLNDIVQQSVSLMQPQASRDRIIIRMALAHGLPNVVADSRSMRQIVLNLLSNSIKFTQPGGQAIISTTMSERGEAVLRVRDTGVGMTERELAIAMEPFRQVASTTPGGTGLGLPLTKALVEANRATFAIQSTKNSGTLVEVVFPSTRVLAE
jgi:PAS domain S-box-containing protein